MLGDYFVDFGGENKIVFREAGNGMGERFNFHITPAKTDIRVMAFGFGDCADLVYKFQSRFEILEFESPAYRFEIIG